MEELEKSKITIEQNSKSPLGDLGVVTGRAEERQGETPVEALRYE